LGPYIIIIYIIRTTLTQQLHNNINVFNIFKKIKIKILDISVLLCKIVLQLHRAKTLEIEGNNFSIW
jgi:hypothetical protein